MSRYAHCHTLMDLGAAFHADVDLKSALGDLAAVRRMVEEYRTRAAQLEGSRP